MYIKNSELNANDFKEMISYFFSISSTHHVCVEHSIAIYLSRKFINHEKPEDISFTLDTVKSFCSGVVFSVNEYYVINTERVIKLVYEYAKTFMLMTYHEWVSDIVSPEYNFFLGSMGFGRVIAPEEIEKLNDRSFRMCQIHVGKGLREFFRGAN